MRLNKYIANAGITSRRKADEMIAEARVEVNGVVVTEMGYQVQEGDAVLVNGTAISVPEAKVIYAFNKPRGVTTTLDDPHANKTIVHFFPKDAPRLHPIGRLDKDSEGLLLLTNDGELTNELTHPSFEHEKEYIVQTKYPLTSDQIKQLAEGVLLEEGYTSPTTVHKTGEDQFSIILRQGWKRQIRRMVEAAGNRVKGLQRVRVGKLALGDLESGKCRQVKKSDIV